MTFAGAGEGEPWTAVGSGPPGLGKLRRHRAGSAFFRHLGGGIRLALLRAVRAAVLLVLTAACADPGAHGADAGVDAAPGPRWQGAEARGELVVNEVAPRPSSGADWIELHNRSDEALDLCDYFVTDSLDRLDHYLPLGGAPPPEPCEARLLAPGAYLVVTAGDAFEPGLDEAPFALGLADETHVVTATGLAVDSLFYLYPSDGGGDSLARSPDGEGRFTLVAPTPGAANPEVAP